MAPCRGINGRVPSAVPSVDQSMPSDAELARVKNARPREGTKVNSEPAARDGCGPGVRSPSGRVPARVPSDTHGSHPRASSHAWKRRRSPNRERSRGWEWHGPGQMSVNRQVPSEVPSLRQISWPWAGSCAAT